MSLYIRKKEQGLLKEFNLLLSWGKSGSQANKILKEKYGYGLRLQVQNQEYSRFNRSSKQQQKDLSTLHHLSSSYTTIKTKWSSGIPGQKFMYNYSFKVIDKKTGLTETRSLNMSSSTKLRIYEIKREISNSLYVLQLENSEDYDFKPSDIDLSSVEINAIYEMEG